MKKISYKFFSDECLNSLSLGCGFIFKGKYQGNVIALREECSGVYYVITNRMSTLEDKSPLEVYNVFKVTLEDGLSVVKPLIGSTNDYSFAVKVYLQGGYCNA